MKETEAAYLAGLIDGEGTIVVNRTNTSKSAKACKRGYSYRAHLAISMTDEKMIRWVKRITNLGQIGKASKPKNPKHKRAWRWSVWSREASTVLLIVYPYLRLKKTHATNLIRFQKHMRMVGSRGLTNKEWNRREKHRVLSLSLNKRGC